MLYKELESYLSRKYPWAESPIKEHYHVLDKSPVDGDKDRGDTLDILRILRNNLAHRNVDNLFEVSQEALDFFTKAIEKDPKLLTVTELYKACCHVGIGNKNAAMKILKHPLSEKLDKSVKEIVAGLNGCRYYYYGIPVSSATRYIYKFEENLEFIMNLCLCIGSTFENLNNKGKAKETYELMLKLDPNNTFAKLAIRRLDTSFWDKLFS